MASPRIHQIDARPASGSARQEPKNWFSSRRALTFREDAGVAQLAEQLFCKQQGIGSIPFAGFSCALAARDLLLVDIHEPMQVDQVSVGALSAYSNPAVQKPSTLTHCP